MPDAVPAPQNPQGPAPGSPESGTDASGLRIEPGFVGSSVNRTRAQRIQQAMQAAVDEVGEVSPEQRAAEMAGEVASPAAAKETEPAEPPEKPAKASKAKAKPKDEEPAAPAEASEPVPSVHELVHERRRLRANHEAKVRQLEQDFQAKTAQLQQHASRLQPLLEAAEALDAGDFDGIAAGLAKFKGNGEVKDWNTLVDEATKAAGMPMYREVRAMKARERAREEADRKQRAEYQQQMQAQQRAAQEQQWLSSIADDLTSDEDSAVGELVDHDQAFAHHVYGAQQRHHQNTGEILPAREAAGQVLGDLYKNWAKWGQFFEKHAASPFLQKITGVKPPGKTPNGTASRNGESGTADRNGVRKPAAKAPPAVSQNRTAEASAMGRPSGAALKRMYAEKMNEAAKDDPRFAFGE